MMYKIDWKCPDCGDDGTCAQCVGIKLLGTNVIHIEAARASFKGKALKAELAAIREEIGQTAFDEAALVVSYGF